MKIKLNRHILMYIGIGIATAIDMLWTTNEVKKDADEEIQKYIEEKRKEEES